MSLIFPTTAIENQQNHVKNGLDLLDRAKHPRRRQNALLRRAGRQGGVILG